MSNEVIGRKAAEKFRQEFDLGTDPITNIARLIERKVGIGVAFVDVPSPGHGMTMSFGDKYLMAVGCTNNPMRLRSTLAHELGHIRLSSVDQYLTHDSWERGDEEIQADSFARHFLVPREAVLETTRDTRATLSTLSDLVQRYQASPHIVAIQLREVKAIDRVTYEKWKSYTSQSLALQFGWDSEYKSLVAHSSTPRAPQALLARAVEGYRWNLVSPTAVARLEGKKHPDEVVSALVLEGIDPRNVMETAASRPPDSGDALTAEELAALMDSAE